MPWTDHVLTADSANDHAHEHGDGDDASRQTATDVSDFSTNSIKWGSTSFGTFGGTVTWSAASTNFAGQLVTFDSPVSGAFLSATRDAFNAWEAVANIKFSEVTDAVDVDIRLGFDEIDGSSGVLAQAFTRFGGGGIISSEIRFDSAEPYVVGSGNVGPGNFNFGTVAIHEIGHAVGIGHSNASTAIMRSFIDRDVNSLQPDDIAAI